MATSYKIQTDLDEAKAMADGLSDYVRGDELYGNTGGSFFSKMPSLTVGALLMRLRRLDGLRSTLSSSQASRLDAISTVWKTTRDDWRLHYEEKMIHESESRLNAMKTFFRECADSQLSCYNNYRPELLRRTIIQELIFEMSDLKVEDKKLMSKVSSTDMRLRNLLRSDEFQWDEQLQTVYPESDFWWLYQKPPKSPDEE